MAGMDLPLGVVRHQYLVTNTIPEVAELKRELPFLRDLEYSLGSRQERQGIAFGAYEDAERMEIKENWCESCVC